jgi:hypothetical protein
MKSGYSLTSSQIPSTKTHSQLGEFILITQCIDFLPLFNIYLLLPLLTNDQVKEDEMGRACSTNGGKDECI